MKKLILLTLLIGSTQLCANAKAETYKFKVDNSTKQKIVKLLVSEDGEKWSPFNLGTGIEAGQSATLEWNEETDDQDCEQEAKATFSDGSESKVNTYDFCDSNLTIRY